MGGPMGWPPYWGGMPMCWGGMPMGCPYGLRVKFKAITSRGADISGAESRSLRPNNAVTQSLTRPDGSAAAAAACTAAVRPSC